MYIQYLIVFQDCLTQIGKILNLISAFFGSGSKINVIHLNFIKKLIFIV